MAESRGKERVINGRTVRVGRRQGLEWTGAAGSRINTRQRQNRDIAVYVDGRKLVEDSWLNNYEAGFAYAKDYLDRIDANAPAIRREYEELSERVRDGDADHRVRFRLQDLRKDMQFLPAVDAEPAQVQPLPWADEPIAAPAPENAPVGEGEPYDPNIHFPGDAEVSRYTESDERCTVCGDNLMVDEAGYLVPHPAAPHMNERQTRELVRARRAMATAKPQGRRGGRRGKYRTRPDGSVEYVPPEIVVRDTEGR